MTQSKMFIGFCIVALSAMAFAAPQMPPPGSFPPLPRELEQVLPADAVEKLKAIHGDTSLGFKEKHEKIDQIMSSLPADVLDKIPPPPGFAQLPQDVQQKLKAINRNPNISWEEKQKQTKAVIEGLPPHLRHLLPPPMPLPPRFRSFA
uniref:Uncharacterized protein n=1 Tax=Panagrolaimus davidi TaxID=227884 RepID=A0A914PMF6_9BILA